MGEGGPFTAKAEKPQEETRSLKSDVDVRGGERYQGDPLRLRAQVGQPALDLIKGRRPPLTRLLLTPEERRAARGPGRVARKVKPFREGPERK